MSRDSVTDHNRKMWERLSKAGHPYTLAEGQLPNSRIAMRRYLDPNRRLDGMKLPGKRVLALAAGGGWDGVIFSKLGAKTTLVDISDRQIKSVKDLASKEQVALKAYRGDMKDLSRFGGASFDLVWHCHSLVFVDEIETVFREVGRVLAPNGTYITSTMHPTTLRLFRTYTGGGWSPLTSYFDDSPMPWINRGAATWEWDEGAVYAPTKEYGHRIESPVNGIVAAGMLIDGLWEYSELPPDPGAEPGSDEHLESLFPTYVQIRARKLD